MQPRSNSGHDILLGNNHGSIARKYFRRLRDSRVSEASPFPGLCTKLRAGSLLLCERRFAYPNFFTCTEQKVHKAEKLENRHVGLDRESLNLQLLPSMYLSGFDYEAPPESELSGDFDGRGM